MNVNMNNGGFDKRNNRLTQENFKNLKDIAENNETGIFNHDDNVNVSFKTFDLKALKASVMEFPDVRPGKVADIKNQVNNGTYTISDNELAECIIKDASLIF
ncbi:MAG: flagellar biosynthesis anti-sigma factor FlgM [Acidobacteria bacterium]|nr:flagellar biosynthesis anti-sigma factor FlgM [Acidobacteriota bacterium]